MHYQIYRNGQTYGPYTLDDLQRYVTTGNVLPTDLAKSDVMPDWVPVSQVLAAQPSAAQPVDTAYAQPSYTAYTQANYADPSLQPVAIDPALASSPYQDAPNLQWGLVILFTVLTCGLFVVVWDIVIAVWLRRVQPSDNSLFYYLGSLGLRVLQWVLLLGFVGLAFGHNTESTGFLNTQSVGYSALSKLFTLSVIGLIIAANFIKRASLLEHFNGPENVGLRLDGVMTFFFASFYFQYHLNRINAMKQAARYGTPRAL